jgi:hypothetical protein
MKVVAKKGKRAPDLLIDTTEDNIPDIPAKKTNVESTVAPNAGVCYQRNPHYQVPRKKS